MRISQSIYTSILSVLSFAVYGQGSGNHANIKVEAIAIASMPIITLEVDSIHLGTIKKGEQVPLAFAFTNTGNADLHIEIVTSCKCTVIEWPVGLIAPGESNVISAIFDTSQQQLGPVNKTLDIVANTDPLLIEARFTAIIVE